MSQDEQGKTGRVTSLLTSLLASPFSSFLLPHFYVFPHYPPPSGLGFSEFPLMTRNTSRQGGLEWPLLANSLMKWHSPQPTPLQRKACFSSVLGSRGECHWSLQTALPCMYQLWCRVALWREVSTPLDTPLPSAKPQQTPWTNVEISTGQHYRGICLLCLRRLHIQASSRPAALLSDSLNLNCMEPT